MSTHFEGIEVAATSHETRQQLEDKGYANVAFDLGKAVTEELFVSFKNFVRLCQEPGGGALADAVTFDVNERGNGQFQMAYREPGKENPLDKESGVGDDHKQIMHFGARTQVRAHSALGKTLPTEMDIFLGNCAEFYTEGRRVGKLAAQSVGIAPIMFPRDWNNDVHHLRLIDYIASDSQQLGKAHFDRGVMTLAINESSPGLRGAMGDSGYMTGTESGIYEHFAPIDHHENVAKFFASAGFRRLPPELQAAHRLEKVPLLAHDIVNNQPGENRQAVVMFFNPDNTLPYTIPAREERLPRTDRLKERLAVQ